MKPSVSHFSSKRLALLFASEFGQLRAKKVSAFTPFAFALVILLIQQMLWTDLPRDLLVRVFISEVYIATILSVFIGLLSSFESETEDGVLDNLRVWPFGLGDLYLVKVASNWLKSACLGMGVSLAGALLTQFELTSIYTFLAFELILFLAILGMTSIGCLLVLLTLGSRSRGQFLHLMFFPLILPVLIGAVEASRQLLEFGASFESLFQNWLGLVMIVSLLYLGLGISLAQEIQSRRD